MLDTPANMAFEDLEIKKARAQLRKLYEAGEKKFQKAELPRVMTENIRRLADLVGLSAIDCRILEFVTLLHNDRLLDDTADWLDPLSTAQVYQALSVILALPEADIRKALASKGVLTQSGIVSVDRTGPARLRSKLDLLSNRFAESMLIAEEDPVALLHDMVLPGMPPHLKAEDYEQQPRACAPSTATAIACSTRPTTSPARTVSCRWATTSAAAMQKSGSRTVTAPSS